MAQATFSIGRLAKASGVKVTTIRFYESIGLLPVPKRSLSERRLYDDEDARRLSFIRHGRELGFASDDLRTLLALADAPHQACGDADAIARRHLASVKAKIAALRRLERELVRMTNDCDHDRVSTCRVIETLADHGLCASPHAAAGSSNIAP